MPNWAPTSPGVVVRAGRTRLSRPRGPIFERCVPHLHTVSASLRRSERPLCTRASQRRRAAAPPARCGKLSWNRVSLEPNYLLASMLVSGIGFVLFSFGRRRERFLFTVIGVVMLVYPVFVSNIAWMLAIAPVLLLLLWIATRLGL